METGEITMRKDISGLCWFAEPSTAEKPQATDNSSTRIGLPSFAASLPAQAQPFLPLIFWSTNIGAQVFAGRTVRMFTRP